MANSVNHVLYCIKTVLLLFAALLMAIYLCACQSSPDRNIITSKNDGSFDANAAQSANEDNVLGSVKRVTRHTDFQSTDNSVQFVVDIDQDISTSNMPIVEVQPYFITESDAKRVAEALFNDATFYESEPLFGGIVSKKDIQSSIQRWSEYCSGQKLLELYPECADFMDEISEIIKNGIASYTERYDDAPDGNPYTPCKWTFRPESTYMYSAEKLAELDLDLSKDLSVIDIDVDTGNIPYALTFYIYDREEFKLSYISAYPNTRYSPWSIDESIFHAQLCRTSKPTQAQIDAALKKAQEILDEIGLGQWVVDESYLETQYVGDAEEYIIHVNAVPIFNGVPVIRRPQIDRTNSESIYSASYYFTDVHFEFTATGNLIQFRLDSPLDIVRVVNENVAVLPFDTLMDTAQKMLIYSDYQAYGLSGDLLNELEREAGENFMCKVEICNLEFGLIRVNVPNLDYRYYYVPGIIVYGTVDYYGKDSQTLYQASGETLGSDRVVPLIALNAVDGSVIELS